MPIDPLTGMMIMQGAGQVIGAIAGGTAKRPEMPEYIRQMMMEMYDLDTYAGFLPDDEAFERSYWGKVNETMSRLPVAKEAFNAELASRGLHGAGEAPKYMYSDVYAPVARSVAGVAAETGLARAEMRQRGAIATQQLRAQTYDTLMRYYIAELGGRYEDYFADISGRNQFWGGLAEMGSFLALKQSGAFNYGGAGGGTVMD